MEESKLKTNMAYMFGGTLCVLSIIATVVPSARDFVVKIADIILKLIPSFFN